MHVLKLLLGAPFLLYHPVAYLSRSFELNRVFKLEWTVNFKFLSEELFVSPILSVALLGLTVATLALFATKWIRFGGRIKTLKAGSRYVKSGRTEKDNPSELCGGKGRQQLLPEYVVKTLFVSNFIGIVFCRSLHYQASEESDLCSLSAYHPALEKRLVIQPGLLKLSFAIISRTIDRLCLYEHIAVLFCAVSPYRP